MNIDLKKYVIDNFKVRGLFLLFQILLTFILPLTLSPEKFGLLSLVFTNANFVLMLTSLGLPSALNFFASKNPLASYNLFRIHLISSIIQLIIVGSFEWVWYSIKDQFALWPTTSFFLGFSGLIWYLGLTINEKLSGIYNGLLKADLYLKFSSFFLLAQIILLGSNHMFHWWMNENASIYIVIYATCIQGIFISLLFYYSSKNLKQSNLQFKTYWPYAISAYIANLIQFLATKSDIWLINYFKQKEDVGYYAFATKLGQLFLVLPIMLASIVFPLLSSGKMNKNIFESLIRSMNGFLMISAISALMITPLLIPIFWKGQYNLSIIPLLYIIPGFIAQAQTALYAAYFSSINKIKINILNSIIVLSALYILNIYFLPKYGIVGASISFSIANILGWLVILYQYNKEANSFSFRLIPSTSDLTAVFKPKKHG